MDYLQKVTQGYFNENNRAFLEKYFLREYKKAAKKQLLEADEFFTGCLKVIEGWEKYLQDKIFKRKSELYFLLNEAKTGNLSYNNMDGKTIEQKRQETIEYCEQELKDVRPDGIGSLTFTVHLHSLTNGRIAYNMEYNEVLQIKFSILNAFQKTQTNIEPLPPHQNEAKTGQAETLSDLITNINSTEIVEKVKIKYRNIKGKRLKLLLKAFQDLELLPKERIAKKFYNCCKNEFDWNIASYNAMNGYNYNERTDKDEIETMKKFLVKLTKTK